MTFPLLVSLKVRCPKKITRRLNPKLKPRVFSCLKFSPEKNESKNTTQDLCKVHLPVSLDRETASLLRHRSLVFWLRTLTTITLNPELLLLTVNNGLFFFVVQWTG